MVRLSKASKELLFCIAILSCVMSDTEAQVTLSRTMTDSNLHTICPDEMVLIYCATTGNGLAWEFPIEGDNLVSFFADDTAPPVQRRGSITVWRDSSQPLSSHVEVPYSPELSNSTFTCESGEERLNLTYKLADVPLEPDIMNYTFLSNSLVKLEWRTVDAAKYYLVTSYLPAAEQDESSRHYQTFQTNDTSHTILYHEGMIVTVHSVNACHMKSFNCTSKTIQMSEASYQELLIVHSSKLIILLASLATVEGVIISIVAIVSIGAVCRYYYKKRSNLTVA